MKERPILFSAPMVRVILEGKKTVTRRIMKPQPPEGLGRIFVEPFKPIVVDRYGEEQPGPEIFGAYDEDGEWGAKCPYGKPGDGLWVRENWIYEGSSLHMGGGNPTRAERFIRYPADDQEMAIPCPHPEIFKGAPNQREQRPGESTDDYSKYQQDYFHRVRPSIHMPRWASRINLEVTGVRVERLQDITEDDAIREGAKWKDFGRQCGHFGGWREVGDCKSECHPQRNGWTMEPPAPDHEHCLGSARMAFANLINKINGPETWEKNEWVWVVSFVSLG